jgi:hypothetical protein
MIVFIKLSFVLILLYLAFILYQIFIAGLNYDIEKRKISPKYFGDHTGFKSAMRRFKVPWPIKDADPRINHLVTKYNKLTKIFWCSYSIGIPLLIYLGSLLNKL